MAYNNIFRSMVVLQKEKLVVIKKELLHLKQIANFYQGENKTQKEQIASKIFNDINHYLSVISLLNEKIDVYYEKYGITNRYYLEFLTLYDYYNEDIKELLKIIQLIQTKFLQFQHEHFNQYMPVPNINKRYSTKGFLDYLKSYHTEVIKTQYLTEDHHPITFWGHQDTFIAHDDKYLEFYDKSNKGEKYIEIPFWHYEIPFMLPFITHEMGHIVLDKEQNGSALYELKKLFYEDDELKDIIKENDSIIDEILSDIFALLLHGDAYIIAQTHELLGKNFVYQFYTQIEKNPVNIIDFALKDNIKFTEALIRLLVIIDISNIFASREKSQDGDKESKSPIEEIKDILEWLIPPLNVQNDDYTLNIIEMLEKNSNNLGNIYKQYNLIKTYRDFHYKITLLPNRIAYIINNKIGKILNLFNQIALSKKVGIFTKKQINRTTCKFNH